MAEKSLIRRIKDIILFVVRIPEKIKVKIYQAAARGDIWFPDKAFQKWDYKIHTGRKLNLKNPKTFQEKLQWMKLYYRNPLYTQLVDKYAVREWVADKIGDEYLCPIYGVYDSWEDIDFSKFPDKFVLKCTHDSGSVVICRDKSSFDFKNAEEIIKTGLKRKQFYLSREWPYKNVKPRIICEKYLEDELVYDAPDYKFFCFDGKVKFLLENSERHSATGLKTNYYYPDFTRIPVRESVYPNNPNDNSKPEMLDEMINLAEILSSGMPHVRVDFNYVNNQIYFGEMTFYHCGGRDLYRPDEYNLKFGEYINLPPKMR